MDVFTVICFAIVLVCGILLFFPNLGNGSSKNDEPDDNYSIEIGDNPKFNEKIKLNGKTIHNPYSGGLGCAPAPSKEFGEESGCKPKVKIKRGGGLGSYWE